jgi:hypothetical protein
MFQAARQTVAHTNSRETTRERSALHQEFHSAEAAMARGPSIRLGRTSITDSTSKVSE